MLVHLTNNCKEIVNTLNQTWNFEIVFLVKHTPIIIYSLKKSFFFFFSVQTIVEKLFVHRGLFIFIYFQSFFYNFHSMYWIRWRPLMKPFYGPHDTIRVSCRLYISSSLRRRLENVHAICPNVKSNCCCTRWLETDSSGLSLFT